MLPCQKLKTKTYLNNLPVLARAELKLAANTIEVVHGARLDVPVNKHIEGGIGRAAWVMNFEIVPAKFVSDILCYDFVSPVIDHHREPTSLFSNLIVCIGLKSVLNVFRVLIITHLTQAVLTCIVTKVEDICHLNLNYRFCRINSGYHFVLRVFVRPQSLNLLDH